MSGTKLLPEPEANRLYAVIEKSLRSYRCHHTIEDNENDGLPLVDKLCPPEAVEVTEGVDELKLLADHVFSDVENYVVTRAPSAPETGRSEHEWATKAGTKMRVEYDLELPRAVMFFAGAWREQPSADIYAAEIARLANLTPPKGEG